MSSSPLSSKNSTFVPSQANYFNRENSNLTSLMNVNRHSPGPPSTTTTTTRIIGPKPFYRSRATPEPYDYINHHRRENDYQQSRQNPFPRRGSVNQLDGKIIWEIENSYAWEFVLPCDVCACMMHVVLYFVVNDDDEESLSSDESLSIEFPPPPSEFSSSPVSDQPYQFVPVKHSFAPTNIIRSDSGKISLLNSIKRFDLFQFSFIVFIIISKRFLVKIFVLLLFFSLHVLPWLSGMFILLYLSFAFVEEPTKKPKLPK